MPYVSQVAAGIREQITIFGDDYPTPDGTGIRDYIHVVDLADGHVAMLKNNKLNKGLKIYNFGTGKGISVLELIKAFEKHTKIFIPYIFVNKRKGDVPISFCSARKANKELNWKAKINLAQAIIDIKKTI